MRSRVILGALIISLLLFVAYPNIELYSSESFDKTYKGYYTTTLSFDEPGVYTILVSIDQSSSINTYDVKIYKNTSTYYPEFEDIGYGYEYISFSHSTYKERDYLAIPYIVNVPGNYTLAINGYSLTDAKVDVKVFKFGEAEDSLSVGTNKIEVKGGPGAVYKFTPTEDGLYLFSVNQTANVAPYFVHFLALKTSSSLSYGYLYYDVYLNGKKVGRYFNSLDSYYPVIIPTLNDSLSELNNNITVKFYGISESFSVYTLDLKLFVKEDDDYTTYSGSLSVNALINTTNSAFTVLFNLSDILSPTTPNLRLKIVSTDPKDYSPLYETTITGNTTSSIGPLYLKVNTTYLFYFEREETANYALEFNITMVDAYSLTSPGELVISSDENSTNDRYIVLEVPEPGKAWVLSLSVEEGDNWTATLQFDGSTLAQIYKFDGDEAIKTVAYLLLSNSSYKKTVINTKIEGEYKWLTYLVATADKINNISLVSANFKTIGLQDKLILTLTPTPLSEHTPTVKFKISISSIEGEPLDNVSTTVGEFETFAKLFKLDKLKIYHISVTGSAYFGLSSVNQGLSIISTYGITESYDWLYWYFSIANSSFAISNAFVGQGYLLVLAMNTTLSINVKVIEPKVVQDNKIVDNMELGLAIYKIEIKDPAVKVKVENETLGGTLFFVDDKGVIATGIRDWSDFSVELKTGYEKTIGLKKAGTLYVLIFAKGPIEVSFGTPESWSALTTKTLTNNIIWGLIIGVVVGAVMVVVLIRKR